MKKSASRRQGRGKSINGRWEALTRIEADGKNGDSIPLCCQQPPCNNHKDTGGKDSAQAQMSGNGGATSLPIHCNGLLVRQPATASACM